MIRSDYKSKNWASDIDTFARYKNLFKITTSENGKAWLIGRMQYIQSKWPDHIKASEIPCHKV